MEFTESKASNFIEEFVEEDLKSGRFDHVRTRFPPEPNGYLHIGHCCASISASPRNTAASRTCALTTPTPPRKTPFS